MFAQSPVEAHGLFTLRLLIRSTFEVHRYSYITLDLYDLLVC